jgi:2,3-bisphosphoglycerate-independent phosphoglycerate mutase
MEASRAILRHHPVNQERIKAGLKPANCLWLWGQSKPVELSTMKEQWAIQGAVVSQSGPYRGVAMASGLQVVNLEEHGEDTPAWLQRMSVIASKILEKQDLACLHLPFAALASPQGSSAQASMYVKILEQIDKHLLGPLQQAYVETGEGRLFVVATPCAVQADKDSLPFARYVLSDGQKSAGAPSTRAFHDQEVSTSPLHNAATFFERFFGKK